MFGYSDGLQINISNTGCGLFHQRREWDYWFLTAQLLWFVKMWTSFLYACFTLFPSLDFPRFSTQNFYVLHNTFFESAINNACFIFSTEHIICPIVGWARGPRNAVAHKAPCLESVQDLWVWDRIKSTMTDRVLSSYHIC